MSRLLYEHSVSHRGYLIIPCVFATVWRETIYSYKLVSELGHQGKFHRADNPSQVCDSTIKGIIDQAKAFLDQHSDILSQRDYFKQRYTYRDNLIIINHEAGKWFYDHYPPGELRNVAAPRLFTTERECINWIRQGLDRAASTPPPVRVSRRERSSKNSRS